MILSSLAQFRSPGFATISRSILSGLLISFFAGSSHAQVGGIDPDPGDPGSGGRHTIQGTIFVANGRRLDRRAKVRLRSINGDLFMMSDDSGAFSFRRLKGGTYTITVDAGSDFEVAYETVDIIELPRRGGGDGHTQTLQLTLSSKKGTLGPGGTVDASTAGVPDAARALYKDALEAAQLGDGNRAIEKLEAALKIHPNYMSALNELGLQYMRLKKLDKAEESLRQALKIAPEAFTPRLNYGILLLQKKDYAAAATELQRAAQKDSSSAAAHLHLGKAFVNLAIYNKAEKELKQAIGIGGDDAIEAHRYLAAVYIEQQNSIAAANELELYLKLAPTARDAERIRGMIKDLRSQASNKTN
ncbi:MAG TPA: tetratricopeptide repeat protein [Blastocatellia bacterium]|nr:tetratricopeptide repeat protein [Blastocatellia bacterium]